MAKKQNTTSHLLSTKKVNEINEGFRIIYCSESEEIARMKAAFAKYGIK